MVNAFKLLRIHFTKATDFLGNFLMDSTVILGHLTIFTEYSMVHLARLSRLDSVSSRSPETSRVHNVLQTAPSLESTKSCMPLSVMRWQKLISSRCSEFRYCAMCPSEEFSISVPETESDCSKWSRLISRIPGRKSLGGDIKSLKHCSLSPKDQLRFTLCNSGHNEKHKALTVAHEHDASDKFFSWGRRASNHDSWFCVMTTALRLRDLGCRLTMPIRWACTIRLRLRSIKDHSWWFMPQRLNALDTDKHRARSG